MGSVLAGPGRAAWSSLGFVVGHRSSGGSPVEPSEEAIQEGGVRRPSNRASLLVPHCAPAPGSNHEKEEQSAAEHRQRHDSHVHIKRSPDPELSDAARRRNGPTTCSIRWH